MFASRFGSVSLLLCVVMPGPSLLARDEAIGIFEGHTDVGELKSPGTSVFDQGTGEYTLSAGGTNMWFAKDDLHFVWTKVEGDVSLAASIALTTEGGDPHRKACLLIRQTLDTDSAYADAVLHGDGLCSIQYRELKGDNTHEIQSAAEGPQRLRIEKRGEYVSMSIGESADSMKPAGGVFRIHFDGPFYVGLGVCAHNAERTESAVFSDVVLEELTSGPTPETLESSLETISIASTDRRVIYHTTDHIEAPNWTNDGSALLFNSDGGLFRIPVTGGEPTRIPTGELTRLNNDHGISPDGRTLVISDQTRQGGSRIYTLPIEGGTPTLITETAPSYWHGWSPDGQTLTYCAQRNGDYNIFTIPVAGGTETQLTDTKGLDDGPDYSPDGKTIYFNSERSGRMHIWAMNADGSSQRQITKDDHNNWFAHPSPDGRWLVFLSYEKEVVGHPENKDVLLRLMPTTGGEVRTLAKLFGGQGTINVPSWSPDSRNVAFVSYQWAY